MALAYNVLTRDVNGVPNPISGSPLARNQYDLVARAFMGRDLHESATHLVRPTLNQCAALCRVSSAYIHWAIRGSADRAKIEAGLMPLVPRPVNNNKNISDHDLLNLVRYLGVNRVLNAAAAVEEADDKVVTLEAAE